MIFIQPFIYNAAQPVVVQIENVKSDRSITSSQESNDLDRKRNNDLQIKHMIVFLNLFTNAKNKLFDRALPKEKWDVVYDGLNQSEPLHIKGMKNVLIKNSTFKNIENSHAIKIEDSDNIRIENVAIEHLSGKRNLSGVGINDSTNVTVKGSIISKIFSSGQSAGIKIIGARSANITIDDNHIYNTYGNGIVSDGSSNNAATQTVHDTPVPGLKIINNSIHDTGKTPTPRSNSPTHGMYIKAQDAYIANNTVYNSFDGTGISLRSTATVVNNRVWDTKLSAVGFLQMKPAGPSMKSTFENNELFYTENRPKGTSPLLGLNWQGEEDNYPLRYDDFTIRNNKFSICTEVVNRSPIIKLYPFNNLTIANNDLVDRRKNTRFFSYHAEPPIRYENDKSMNSFNQIDCITDTR